MSQYPAGAKRSIHHIISYSGRTTLELKGVTACQFCGDEPGKLHYCTLRYPWYAPDKVSVSRFLCSHCMQEQEEAMYSWWDEEEQQGVGA